MQHLLSKTLYFGRKRFEVVAERDGLLKHRIGGRPMEMGSWASLPVGPE